MKKLSANNLLNPLSCKHNDGKSQKQILFALPILFTNLVFLWVPLGIVESHGQNEMLVTGLEIVLSPQLLLPN